MRIGGWNGFLALFFSEVGGHGMTFIAVSGLDWRIEIAFFSFFEGMLMLLSGYGVSV
jgi:hypothetical protein